MEIVVHSKKSLFQQKFQKKCQVYVLQAANDLSVN